MPSLPYQQGSANSRSMFQVLYIRPKAVGVTLPWGVGVGRDICDVSDLYVFTRLISRRKPRVILCGSGHRMKREDKIPFPDRDVCTPPMIEWQRYQTCEARRGTCLERASCRRCPWVTLGSRVQLKECAQLLQKVYFSEHAPKATARYTTLDCSGASKGAPYLGLTTRWVEKAWTPVYTTSRGGLWCRKGDDGGGGSHRRAQPQEVPLGGGCVSSSVAGVCSLIATQFPLDFFITSFPKTIGAPMSLSTIN
jgi:hypothetical protein